MAKMEFLIGIIFNKWYHSISVLLSKHKLPKSLWCSVLRFAYCIHVFWLVAYFSTQKGDVYWRESWDKNILGRKVWFKLAETSIRDPGELPHKIPLLVVTAYAVAIEWMKGVHQWRPFRRRTLRQLHHTQGNLLLRPSFTIQCKSDTSRDTRLHRY